MLRFLTIVWDEANPQQHEAAQLIASRVQSSPSWRPGLSAPGMQVFCAGIRRDAQELHRLSNGAGIVIGTLFARSTDPMTDQPDEQLLLGDAQTAAIVDSRGRWLIEHGWGNYVAFGRDPKGGSKWVLNDPMGALPCLRTAFRGVTIFFSRMADVVELHLLRFSINEEYMRAQLMLDNVLRKLPALNEVSPVGRGECIEFTRSAGAWKETSSYYWKPSSFARCNDLLEDPEYAARAMRATVQAATSSWTQLHPSLLLRLSGGLDSSVIAGCLKQAPGKSRFVAYTYFNPKGRSDERPWARLAAQHSGCEHIEQPIASTDLDLSLGLQMAPSPEPSPLLSYLQRTTLEQTLATRSGATAVFSGDGGDSGFCSDSISYAVPEYLRNRGFGPGIFRLASQVALLTQKSSWNVLTSALRRRGTGDFLMPRDRVLEACALVSPQIRQASSPSNERLPHPWFEGGPGIAWDKARRLGMLIMTPEFYNVTAPDDAIVPEVVSPLYSQPVIELFLRIPIYTHFHQGKDRGLARRAFVNEVPEPILRRMWKDRAPGFHDEVIERQRSFLRETMLDGVLVRNGLLDRALLEEILSSGPSKSTVFPGELFRHLDTELWARHWLTAARQQVAA